jgi:hypothetical protein
MVPGIYLTELVLAVCVLHLVWRLRKAIRRFRASSVRTQRAASKSAVQRDDWYMFFHCSDLTGEKKKPSNKSTLGTTQCTTPPRPKRDSRSNAHRYI